MSNYKVKEIKGAYLDSNRQAVAGHRLIRRYIRRGDVDGLFWLLRHHREGKIRNEETWLRDEVDYLLEYFSVLGLALTTGYLRLNDLQEEREEIEYYLLADPVERYYTKHYEIQFPQILWRTLEKRVEFDRKDNPDMIEREFMTFHALNQTIDNDDVNQFLWFLDGGWNNGSNVDALRKVLLDVPRAIKMVKSKSRDALNQSVRGFFEYLEFLDDFEEFIGTVENKFSRSAYWYYHNYWFRRIGKHLRSVIADWHNGMERFAESKRGIKDVELKDDLSNSLSSYGELLENVVNNLELKELFENGIKQKIRGVF